MSKIRPKVLLICPNFFGYHDRILDAARSLNYDTFWLNHIPSSHTATKALFRAVPKLAQTLATPYYVWKFRALKDIDRIIIVKGEGVSIFCIRYLRKLFPSARVSFYLWDSLANTPTADEKIDECDISYSFDPCDCEVSPRLNHLPLFHSAIIKEHIYQPGFAAFVGTLHSDRFIQITKVAEAVSKVTGVPAFVYFFFPSKWTFEVLRFFKPRMKTISRADVHFQPLSYEIYRKVEDEASIVIDVCHSKQAGLTMRTIETMANGKKIITNNATIRQYDFFNPNNCFVMNDKNLDDLDHFLTSPFIPISKEIVENYHILRWVSTLLQESNGA